MPEIAAPNGASTAEAVVSALMSALETMFFEFVEPCQEMPDGQDGLSCSVAFQGVASGNLHLRLERRLGRVLASNFLGLDDDCVSAVEVESVACELANMICGSALSHLHPAALFELSPPRVEHTAGDAHQWHCFRSDSGVLAVSLQRTFTAAA